MKRKPRPGVHRPAAEIRIPADLWPAQSPGRELQARRRRIHPVKPGRPRASPPQSQIPGLHLRARQRAVGLSVEAKVGNAKSRRRRRGANEAEPGPRRAAQSRNGKKPRRPTPPPPQQPQPRRKQPIARPVTHFLPLLFLVSSFPCVIPSVAEGPRIFLNARRRTQPRSDRSAPAKHITRCVVRVHLPHRERFGSLGYARDDTRKKRRRNERTRRDFGSLSDYLPDAAALSTTLCCTLLWKRP